MWNRAAWLMGGVALLTIWAGQAVAQESGAVPLAVGDPAPELTMTEYLNAPPGAPAGLAELRGRWVVVEFWASWCPACVAGIPHMNELASALHPGEAVFITLSGDPRELLEGAFQRRPSRTWVAWDAEGATAERYRIGGYPQAVVIGPSGRVRALVNPQELTVEGLRNLMTESGHSLPHQYFVAATSERADPAWDEETAVDEEAPEIYSQVVLRRSPAPRGFLRHVGTPGRILGDGVSLERLILEAYDSDFYQSDYRLPRSSDRYRVSVVSVEKTPAAARALLRGALEASFHYEIAREPRLVDVVVVRRAEGFPTPQIRPTEAEGSGIAGKAGFHLRDVPMDWLASAMSNILFERPVLDETGLDGHYDVDVDWDEVSEAAIMAAFEAAGLELSLERRRVPFLVVTPLATPGGQ